MPAVLAVALLPACSDPIVAEPPDGGADAAVADAAVADAAVADAAVVDAGGADAAIVDSAVADAGVGAEAPASPGDGCPLTIAAPLGFSPVAVYHLDEASGPQVVESTGHGGSGTIVNGMRGPGACGMGVTLDGAGGRIELPPVGQVLANGVAAELWLRPTSIQAGEAHLVGDGGGGLASFQLVLEDGVPVFRLSDRNSGEWREILRSSRPLRAGVWQHVRAAYEVDVGRGQLLVDGVEVARTTRILPVEPSFNTLYVGAIMESSPCCSIGRQLLADLDEIVVWGK